MTKRIYLAPSSQIHNVGMYKLWGTNEAKNCNLITDRVVKHLAKYDCKIFRGYINTPLYTNEDRANAYGCDAYYSIHTNASSNTSATGVVALYQTSTKLPLAQRKHSARMADCLRDAIVALGVRDRGLKGRLNSTGGEYYADLRRPKMPSTILEIDFHTNRAATYWLVHSHATISLAIANAIAKAEALYMYKGVVNAKDGLNVRTGAGAQNPKAVTTPNPLPYGRLVYVYEERKAKDGSMWCRIENEKSHWVAKRYLTIGG